MPGSLLLIAGPVFSGKSEVARQAIEDGEADLLFEYTALWAATRAVKRDAKGRYPVRADDDAFNREGFGSALVSAGVGAALERSLRVIVSSSKRNAAADWQPVAAQYDAAFSVRLIDPGETVIDARIVAAGDEEECVKAYRRWNRGYRRR